MNILVTGGRGYIGSHACKLLARAGHNVVCIDDESYGKADVSGYAECHRISTRETEKLTALLREKRVDAVMHFAAYIFVGESVEKPDAYYENNVAGTLSLMSAMLAANVKKLIFSSTCATYAELTVAEPLTENHPQNPISPYGRSKLMCEQIMRDYCTTLGFSAVVFRYFNATGADPENEFGEDHVPETHLVPLAVRAALENRTDFVVNGRDFATPDGTAVRDYIHVSDIARAHVLGIDFAFKNSGFHAFNLGNNRGYSILEVLKGIENACSRKINFHFGPRREGDAAMLVGDNALAKQKLGWSPEIPDLEAILKTAVAWEKRRLGLK
ncbi:UDP-glucose 4-epimerase GalE [Turneriella parva]|uniref:UDP-glucose 4-epimerase n=1 Tax=Turneriella parva (strain ATCC BAA-1111 / DSM 21527 / NCTC 11395 / H) TaxID=869212 RepID=I4B5C4_TURPD|nr:UDP-glucose 4-epimerase GalE [Turneriella parva]AFM12481.1 UDP-galactose 4-epimerase [Turneriella parva DSM 21527]